MASPHHSLKLWVASIINDDGSCVLTAEKRQFLLSLLPEAEASAVQQYVQQNDRDRALISRMMQRHLVAQVLGIGFSDVAIGRTALGKPYIITDEMQAHTDKPHNYNVSHHGKFVVLAYSDACLVGVDVVDTHRPRSKEQSFASFLSCFRTHLTDRERASAASYPNSVAQYTHFYVHWALKEAFVKAIGQGIGFDLLSAEFVIRYSRENYEDFDGYDDKRDWPPAIKLDICGRAEMKHHGEVLSRWRFDFWTLDGRHIVAIAKGPVDSAIADYRAKLGAPQETPEEDVAILQAPPAVHQLVVQDMLPNGNIAQWDALR